MTPSAGASLLGAPSSFWFCAAYWPLKAAETAAESAAAATPPPRLPRAALFGGPGGGPGARAGGVPVPEHAGSGVPRAVLHRRGCPARVTEEATRLAEEAKRKGEPKPRKDISAAHRCVLGLGPYAARTGSSAAGSGGDGRKGEGSEETCAVCAGFLTPVAEKLRIEMAGKSAVGDAAAKAADRLLGTACAEAEEAGNSRHSKLCDSLLAARREVARPMGLGVPPGKVCERVARKDPLVCEIKPAKEGDATDDGAGDAAAADAFKRLSLLVHPDKHRGKQAGDAAKAFRELKKAKDHFDLLARRAAEKKEREEAGM